MVVIGEKINGAIPSVAAAIEEREASLIGELVSAQEEAGADYLDVCAGTSPDKEYDALCWLIDVVQEHARKPVCIDSPDPEMLVRVFPKLEKPGLVNSISLEGNKCEILLPLLKDNPEWGVVALCCDNSGVANAWEEKTAHAFTLIEKAAEYGIAPERIHIDPLVLALSAVNDSALNFFEAVRRIKERYQKVNVTAALSNISFGMPARKLVNQNFLTLSMYAGLDSVIMNPLDRELMGAVYATDALMNKDKFCRKYNKAYRNGQIGAKK